MATVSQPNEETLELIRLSHQTNKTLSVICYYDLTDESVKHVFNTLAGYEHNHKSPRSSINDSKDVTANLINVSTSVQNPKYHETPKNQ